MKVFKYPIPFGPEAEVIMPGGAEIIKAEFQIPNDPDSLMIWALVNPSNEPCIFSFFLVGTGHEISSDFHIETMIMGNYVWHLFGNDAKWNYPIEAQELVDKIEAEIKEEEAYVCTACQMNNHGECKNRMECRCPDDSHVPV